MTSIVNRIRNFYHCFKNGWYNNLQLHPAEQHELKLLLYSDVIISYLNTDLNKNIVQSVT